MRWRYFIAAHLHRRLFVWFGVAIFVAVTVASLVHRMVGYRPGHRLLAMLAASAVLWMISGKIARRLARPLHELLRVTEEIGAGSAPGLALNSTVVGCLPAGVIWTPFMSGAVTSAVFTRGRAW